MKKMILIFFCLMTFIFCVTAQDEGIRFEKPEWEKVVRKAVQEKKLIFVDCYTSWCGPCRELAKNIFPQKEVGDFYNRNFISAKVNMDKDAMAEILKKKFTPAAYPTLLFIDAGSGEIVHMAVGGGKAERILEVGKQALDEERNLTGLTKQYQAGKRDAVFIEAYLKALASAYQKERQAAVMADYWTSLPAGQWVTKENWEIFKANVDDPLSSVFHRMMRERENLYRIEEKSEVDQVLIRIIDKGVRQIINPDPYAVLSNEKVDEEKNKAFIAYLQSVDFCAASGALAKLYTAEYERRGDYQAMWNSIEAAYRYNVFRNAEDYYYIWKYIPILAKGTEDMEILKEAVRLMDRLNLENKPLYYRVALMENKAVLEEKQGNKSGAEKARALAEKYREEEEKQQGNE